jgi:hypothetical protein
MKEEVSSSLSEYRPLSESKLTAVPVRPLRSGFAKSPHRTTQLPSSGVSWLLFRISAAIRHKRMLIKNEMKAYNRNEAQQTLLSPKVKLDVRKYVSDVQLKLEFLMSDFERARSAISKVHSWQRWSYFEDCIHLLIQHFIKARNSRSQHKGSQGTPSSHVANN